jgi:hypothetical protein
MKDGAYESQNLVFRDRAVIIPIHCRQVVARALHRAHQGLRAMIRRAEGNVCWPNMRKDLQQLGDECHHCQENWPQQQRQPIMSVDVPTAPGLALASDYFQSKGKEYVLFVDLFSSWTEYFGVNSRRPETLISRIKQFIARNGIPRILYTDKGSAYDSFEFRKFCEDWGIKLVTCSGEYPKGNGTAEAAVKRVKKWLTGAENESDLTRAILTWHQTPIATGRPTPAQLHLGRNVRDEVQTRIEPCTVSWQDVKQWRTAKKESDAQVYDRRSRDLPVLNVGDRIFVSVHGKWRRGIVESKAQRPRSYILRMNDTGSRIERNRVHIRLDKTNKTVPVNEYFFFSAEGKQVNEERRQVPRSPSTSSPEDFTSNEDDEEEEEDQFHDAPRDPSPSPLSPSPRHRPCPSPRGPRRRSPSPRPRSPSPRRPTTPPSRLPVKSNGVRRGDGERQFLSKTHVSRVGRESKKVVPFDPSN